MKNRTKEIGLKLDFEWNTNSNKDFGKLIWSPSLDQRPHTQREGNEEEKNWRGLVTAHDWPKVIKIEAFLKPCLM